MTISARRGACRLLSRTISLIPMPHIFWIGRPYLRNGDYTSKANSVRSVDYRYDSWGKGIGMLMTARCSAVELSAVW